MPLGLLPINRGLLLCSGLGSPRDSLWTLRKLPQPSTRHGALTNGEKSAHKLRNKALTNSVRTGFPPVSRACNIVVMKHTLSKGCNTVKYMYVHCQTNKTVFIAIVGQGLKCLFLLLMHQRRNSNHGIFSRSF
jgi:hypothetical protein